MKSLIPIDKSRTYTYLTAGFLALQFMVPTWNLSEIGSVIVTTIFLTLASVFTLNKQRSSIEIDNQSVILTWVLIGIIVIGGAIDILDSKAWGENIKLKDGIRSGLATLMLMLNLASKDLFKTDAGDRIQNIKNDMRTQAKQIEALIPKK